MTDQSPPGNSFRAAVLRGERPKLVVEQKSPRAPAGERVAAGLVTRSETRRGNHRDEDRHRLADECAVLRHRGERHLVDLINLSDGGAMVRADVAPALWELVELEVGEGMPIEAAVRWLKDGRIGLEFAHETRIDCDNESRAELLLQVIQRSFGGDADENASSAERRASDPDHRGEARHPLIWRGEIHAPGHSATVRLRNISGGGAQIEAATLPSAGTGLVLDLGKAGSIEATVTWSVGDQAGVRFHSPFDLAQLANVRPEVLPPRWEQPAYLKANSSSGSPWADGWNRMSLSDLEGYLKY